MNGYLPRPPAPFHLYPEASNLKLALALFVAFGLLAIARHCLARRGVK